MLILTGMNIDKTRVLYYTNRTLHYLSTKGNTAIVTLGEEGPIRKLSWSSKVNEFAVIHGFIPFKATLFNSQFYPKVEFSKKHLNSVNYNPHGNILMLGILRGLLCSTGHQTASIL